MLSWKLPLVYLGAIVAAELLTSVVNPLWGISLHALILVALLIHASVTWGNPGHQLYLSLSLAPLIRILSLSLPLAGFSQLYWYPLVALPLFLTIFTLIRLLNYRRGQVGLSWGNIPLQFGVALSGLLLGVVEYFILRPKPLISALTWEQLWLAALLLIVGTGFAEELAFRGVMQRSALEAMGVRGIWFVTATFASLHIGFLSLADVIFVFAVGLYFAWAVKKTGSLLGASLGHGLINVTLYLIGPFVL